MAKKQKFTTTSEDNGLKNVSDYRFREATRKNPQLLDKETGYLVRAEFVWSGLDRAFQGEP